MALEVGRVLQRWGLIVCSLILLKLKVSIVFATIALFSFFVVRVALIGPLLDSLVVWFRLIVIVLAVTVASTKVSFNMDLRELLSLALLERTMLFLWLVESCLIAIQTLFGIGLVFILTSAIIISDKAWSTLISRILRSFSLRSKWCRLLMRLECKWRSWVGKGEAVGALRTWALVLSWIRCPLFKVMIVNHARFVLHQIVMRRLLERIDRDGAFLPIGAFTLVFSWIMRTGWCYLLVFRVGTCHLSHADWLKFVINCRQARKLLLGGLGEVLNFHWCDWAWIKAHDACRFVWRRNKSCGHERRGFDTHERIILTLTKRSLRNIRCTDTTFWVFSHTDLFAAVYTI